MANRHDAKYEERRHSLVVGRPGMDADMAKIGVALRSFTFFLCYVVVGWDINWLDRDDILARS